MPTTTAPRTGQNQLLDMLRPAAMAAIEPLLEPVELTLEHKVIEPNVPISHVYFVDTGIISVVSDLDDGHTIEVATIGPEGMVGVPLFLGASTTTLRAFVQVAGTARRMTATAFMGEIAAPKEFRLVIERYSQLLFEQIAQTAACNCVHPVRQRCARWLLMTHDRVHRAKRFYLTQEFLAQMLGVRRASVATVAGGFQREGVIEYSRGVMTIIDRRALETAACGCYAKLRSAQARLRVEAA